MDKITEGLLRSFSSEFDIAYMNEDDRFEHFASYLTVHRHYSETSFDPDDLATGSGNDTVVLSNAAAGSSGADTLLFSETQTADVSLTSGSNQATTPYGAFAGQALPGALIEDETTTANIPAATYVESSPGAGPMTMSNNAAHSTSGFTDTLQFDTDWAC